MKVSIPWLKELVDLNIPKEDLFNLLPLRSVSLKDVTSDSMELDMKGYNRADLLSLRGVAWEIAAITNSNLKFEELTEEQMDWKEKDLPKTNVEITDEKLSPVQVVAKIQNLKVENSNESWVKKLSNSGMRSVNNIVDATNLIMLEYGQPLHAFDAATIKDETIIVRLARKGEEIVTLDGKVRKLNSSDIVLADTEKPLDVAGIMGSKKTEVTQTTNTILLSASLFNPTMVQKTSTRIGLRSEASKRFQHGLTRIRLLQAVNAAIKMYESLGGKLTGLNIVGDLTEEVKKVKLTQKKLNSLVGIEFRQEEVEEYLTKLQFKLKKTKEGWEVTVPYFRLDIEIEEDLIEEVARMYGYEKIPSHKLQGQLPEKIDQSLFNLIYDLKVKLAKIGLTEVQTYSFYSTNVIDALGWNEGDNKKKYLVKVKNPISSETEYLRQGIWPNLIETVGKNLKKGYKDIAIFEIGKAFNNLTDGPREDYRLAIALLNDTDNPAEELISLFKQLEINVELKQQDPPPVVAHLFHPQRFIAFEKNGKQIGGLGEVHLRVLNKLGIEKRVAVLEIEITGQQ